MDCGFIDSNTDQGFIWVIGDDYSKSSSDSVTFADVVWLASLDSGISVLYHIFNVECFSTYETGIGSIVRDENEAVVLEHLLYIDMSFFNVNLDFS